MGPNSLAYRVSLVLAGLHLVTIAVAVIGMARLLSLGAAIAPAEHASMRAVLLVDVFLLVSLFATAASIVIFVRREGAKENLETASPREEGARIYAISGIPGRGAGLTSQSR